MKLRHLLAGLVTGACSLAFAAEPSNMVERVKGDLFFLAGDECSGRGTGSAGIDKAAEHIADSFKKAGLKPGGKNDSYFQPFSYAGRAKLGTPNKAVLTIGSETTELKYGDQFTIAGATATGAVKGDLVFVGYGLNAEKLKYNDYADQDVKGKVVVIIRKTPKAEQKDNPFEAPDFANLSSLVSKIETAQKAGATGVIFVNDRTMAGKTDDLMELGRTGSDAGKIPVIHVKRATLQKMLGDKKLTDIEEAIDKDSKPRSMPLKDCKADLQTTLNRGEVPCKNVVGVLPGAGPLADETIVIGAHYDHLGTEIEGSLAGQAAKGKIHYGADDNASGTTGLLETVRRFTAMKDRVGRRIVFIAFSAEEKGLFGSKHYCKEPLFPLEKTAMMINMDMIGRSIEVDDNGKIRFRISVSGTGTCESFDAAVDAANADVGMKITKVEAGSGPSDHDSFNRQKVPVLFLYTGTHKDYHRPTDTPDKINVMGLLKAVDLTEKLATRYMTARKPVYTPVASRWFDPTDTNPRRGVRMPRIGIMPGNYEEEDKGVLVDGVTPGGAAESAGVKSGDVVIRIAGEPVKNINDYMTIMQKQKVGVEIEVELLRKKQNMKVKLTPKE